MKFFLSGLLTILIFTSFAQQQRQDQLIPNNRNSSFRTPESLEAKFTADVTEGTVPLTVSFTDESTGNPISWKWTFGDGDSSLVQNPVHTYQSTGTFTVKLTISDGTNSFALEKKDYIRVDASYSNCDTLRFPLPEPLTYYTIPGKGYVTGNNSYGDKAISEYFENTNTNLVITGMLCEFSKAKQATGHNEKIPVLVWQAEASSGKPGTVMATDTIMLSTLVSDVAASKLTTIDFENPVHPGGSFSMGLMLPAITGDTLCLWSTSSGKLSKNTTWIMQSNNVWETAEALWTPTGGPAFIISTAIYPKVCIINGTDNEAALLPFAIWPNPAKEVITVVNQQLTDETLTYSITEMSGKTLLKGIMSRSIDTKVDVSTLNSGIYIFYISGKKFFFSSKLVIQ